MRAGAGFPFHGELPAAVAAGGLVDVEGTGTMELASGVPGGISVSSGIFSPAAYPGYVSGIDGRRVLFLVCAGSLARGFRTGVRADHCTDGGKSSKCIHLFPVLRKSGWRVHGPSQVS